MQYFTHNWHHTFHARSKFKNRPVIIVYKVTIHSTCPKYCPPKRMHAWTRLIIVQPFETHQGGREWFDRHQKWVGKTYLRFQLLLNTLGFLSVPTVRSPKDWGRANVVAVLRKLNVSGHTGILTWTYFLALLWITRSWNFSKQFRYTLFIKLQFYLCSVRITCYLPHRKWNQVFKGVENRILVLRIMRPCSLAVSGDIEVFSV